MLQEWLLEVAVVSANIQKYIFNVSKQQFWFQLPQHLIACCLADKGEDYESI